MILLPILRRELVARARSRGTYWTRSAVGLAGVLICLQAMGSAMAGTPAMMGSYVFNAIVWAAFLVTCSICLLSADAISAERREGTLGLLFLTRVKSLDVLLAKLGSVGLTSLSALVAFLPVLMIPVLAGGVTGGDAWRKGLALINALFFALAAGLCVSAAQEERARAVRQAVLIVALVMLVPLVSFVVSRGGVLHYAGLLSPMVALILAGDASYKTSFISYWASLVAVHALAWLLVVGAGIRLRQTLRREEGRGAEVRRTRAVREAGRAVGLGIWQPVKGEANPVEWLVYRHYGVGAGIWSIGVLALAANGWAFLARQPAGGPAGATIWVIAWPLVGGLIGGSVVAWVASRFFVGVRRTGDLELLLTTPLGAETIVTDQWNVLKRLFAWPVLVMQAPMLPKVMALLGPVHDTSLAAWQFHDGAFKLLTLANMFVGTAALCWLGLWFGLKARTQAGAIAWTVGLAQGVPCLISLLGSLASAALLGGFGAGSPPGLLGAIWWFPQAAVLFFSCWLIWLARQRLLGELTGTELPLDLRIEIVRDARAFGAAIARTAN